MAGSGEPQRRAERPGLGRLVHFGWVRRTGLCRSKAEGTLHIDRRREGDGRAVGRMRYRLVDGYTAFG